METDEEKLLREVDARIEKWKAENGGTLPPFKPLWVSLKRLDFLITRLSKKRLRVVK